MTTIQEKQPHEFVQHLESPREKGYMYFIKGDSVYRVRARNFNFFN